MRYVSLRIGVVGRYLLLLFPLWLLTWPWAEGGVVRSLCLVSEAQAGPPSYVYDDNGRLIAVIDPQTETAIYSYDAVGNLLSIARRSSALLSLIDFTPKRGPVGTKVTIYGTAFRATPSQNTVKFNGVAASVTSASATNIVATVPASATTGPISVTTAAGTATSVVPFTVLAAGTGGGGAPTITGFTPTIGAPGDTVSITGTNFDPEPASNDVTFNTTVRGTVTAATVTNLRTIVPPGGTSGRISVVTATGKAVSAKDFFVAPPPYTAADVAFAKRMAIGQTLTVPLNTANKIALVIFEVTAGQALQFRVNSSTFGSTCSSDKFTVLKPDGSPLTEGFAGDATGGTATIIEKDLCANTTLDTPPLPVSGTYTALLDPSSTHVGQVSLTLIAHVTGTLTPGAATQVNIGIAGQKAFLRFAGTAGKRVTLKVNSSTFPHSVTVTLRHPNGTYFTSWSVSDGDFVENSTPLLVTGTYTLEIDPRDTETGQLNFTLALISDLSGTLTPGTAATVTISVPGQDAYLSFAGTAGKRVTLKVNSSTFSSSVDVEVRQPDGSFFDSWSVGSGDFVESDAQLPVTGTYTLRVNPRSAQTGQLNFTLALISDLSGTLTPGTAATVTISVPGQDAYLSFAGTAGKRVTLKVNSSTFSSSVDVEVRQPGGSSFSSWSVGSGDFVESDAQLSVTGTYTLRVNPRSAQTGQINLTLSLVP